VADLHDEAVASLVPPRHRIPSYNVLRRHDIEVVRLASEAERPPTSDLKRFLWTLTRDHPLDRPEANSGIVETQTSPLVTLTAPYLSKGVSDPHPAYRMLPKSVRQRKHTDFLTEGLTAAKSETASVHYWTHLYNTAHENQRKPIASFLAALGNDAEIEIRRLCDLPTEL